MRKNIPKNTVDNPIEYKIALFWSADFLSMNAFSKCSVPLVTYSSVFVIVIDILRICSLLFSTRSFNSTKSLSQTSTVQSGDRLTK